MRDHRDARLMATTLRQALHGRNIELSHSECLEIVARQFGLKNWNILAAALAATPPPAPVSLVLPAGWTKTGRHADHYAAGVDPDVKHDGRGVAVIRSHPTEDRQQPPEDAFATLMQIVSARQWLGRRVALEAQLRTLDVRGAGAIWLRIDSSTGMLAFDNMEERQADRVLTGTGTWTRRRIVLEVGPEAATANYGFVLRGTGTLWATSFDLHEVGQDVATTDSLRRHSDMPTNLDFSVLE